MKQLLILLLISSVGYGQKIDSSSTLFGGRQSRNHFVDTTNMVTRFIPCTMIVYNWQKRVSALWTVKGFVNDGVYYTRKKRPIPNYIKVVKIEL